VQALNLELMPLKKMHEAMTKAATNEERTRVHTAWLEENQRVRLQLGPSVTRIMGTMWVALFLSLSLFLAAAAAAAGAPLPCAAERPSRFGALFVNSIVFVSIFNGVSNLMLSQVRDPAGMVSVFGCFQGLGQAVRHRTMSRWERGRV
jgi:hypothetical protein